jgi:hypothetical protein
MPFMVVGATKPATGEESVLVFMYRVPVRLLVTVVEYP